MMMNDKPTITRAEINEFGAAIQSGLLDGDGLVLLQVGAVAPNLDTRKGSVIAYVEGYIGNKKAVQFSGEAVCMHDAILIARGKFRRAVEQFNAERQKTKKMKGE